MTRGAAGVIRLRVLLAVLLVTVASMAIAPTASAQCTPPTVTSVSIANGATGVPTSGRLTWSLSGSTAGAGVRVYLLDPANSGEELAATDVSAAFTYLDYFDLAPSTQYVWEIRPWCDNADGRTFVGRGHSMVTFTTSACHSNGPTLINPQDGATADHLKTTFAWDPILGNPTGYEVFVQINSTGAFVSQGSTDANTFELTKDIPAGTHKWYVEGKLPGGCPPARSVTWTFGTACPTGAPSLVMPSAGQTLGSPNDVTFSWASVSGADGYDVYVVRNGGTATKIGETREGTNLAGTSILVNLPGTGPYTWYVEALSSGCGNLRSATGNFTVADNCPTTGVTLTAPANNATSGNSPVLLSWSAQPDAATVGLQGYKIYVSVNGATAGVVGLANSSTTALEYYAPPGTHSWFVESVFSNCAPVRSSTFNFTVTGPLECPEVGPTLTSPASGATSVSSPVNFAWTAVPGAGAYTIVVERLGGESLLDIRVNRTIATTSLEGMFLDAGNYRWEVGAHSATGECATVYSSGTFTITAPPTCPTTAPVLVSPAAGATVTRETGELVTFVWEPVPGATSYTLNVTSSGGALDITAADLATTIHKLDLPNSSNLGWTVTANFNGSCAGVSSERRLVSIESPAPCVLATPAIIAPANNAETLSPTVVFSWSRVDNATEYRVYRRTGPNADDRLLLGTTAETSLEKTFDFLDLTFGSNNLSPLDWYVEAHGAARCTQSQSARSLINFRKAQTCSTERPVLQSPLANAPTTSRQVQFNWDRVSGAIGYNVWYSFNGGAPTKLNEQALDASARSAEYTMPLGASEWWVEAIYPGCPGVESLRRTLTITTSCVVTPPTILGPDGTTGTFTSPVTLSWSRVSGATSYDVYTSTGTSPLAPVATVTPAANSTGNITFVYSAQPGATNWKVRANVPNCGSAFSAEAKFTVVAPPPCSTPEAPRVTLQRKASSNQPYNVGWRQVPNALTYEVQESTSPTFSAATTTTTIVTGTQTTFTRQATIDTTYYYRVRARSSCNTTVGAYSSIEEVLVEAPKSGESSSNVGVGSQEVVVRSTFFTNPTGVPQQFTARTDVSWLRVSPASGTMPAAGITLSIVADPKDLVSGTNAGTIIVEFTGAGAGNVSANATTVYTVPVTVNIVTPVVSQGKSEPPSDALVIPAVAAADGANGSQWVSDLRVTNASGEPGRYQVNFTPSRSDANRVTNSTTVDIAAGSSLALDGILRNWFGARAGENAAGVVEVRSLKTGATTSTRRGRQLLGSSRTYNRTAGGTFGQFIPAIPLNEFIGRGKTLVVSELNQSATARTNLGLVEGSGQGANVRVTVFDANGVQLTTFDQYLRGGEHIQLNSFLATRGITNDNARANVEVLTDGGSVMAYASVVDNQTNDPLLLTGAIPAADTTWAIAGVADLDTGAARWRTDVRIFNPAAAAVNATLTFYPSGTPTNSKSITTTIPAGGTRELKDILRNSFSLTAVGGAVHVTTATSTPLLVTARTYNLTTTGTYGQYIPGVAKSQGIGNGDGTIQLQQLEGSATYRTNIGLAEVTGKPAKVELIAVVPGSLATPRATVELKANEFVQLTQIFKSTFGLSSEIYNARLAVRVVEGDGRIIAYASVVDQRTQDPTFVPAER